MVSASKLAVGGYVGIWESYYCVYVVSLRYSRKAPPVRTRAALSGSCLEILDIPAGGSCMSKNIAKCDTFARPYTLRPWKSRMESLRNTSHVIAGELAEPRAAQSGFT
ncbi:hypothetical protein D5086_010194 [Populus alba]|uniref:Uncharacterized protein n=1 Tax=Populus alba TaxID=43335 RepID=A0ACC4C8Z4_POPAL